MRHALYGRIVFVSLAVLSLTSLTSFVRAPEQEESTVHVQITDGADIDFLLNIARAARVEHQVGGSVPAERITHLQRVWNRYEGHLLPGMQNAVGLTFVSPRIEAYILATSGVPMSKPIMIPFESTDDESNFVGTLTHELVHVLMMDNRNGVSERRNEDVFRGIYTAMLPGVDLKVARHIVAFALLQYLFSEVVPDAGVLANQRETNSGGTDAYGKAWDFVEEHGYHRVLESFQINLRNRSRK